MLRRKRRRSSSSSSSESEDSHRRDSDNRLIKRRRDDRSLSRSLNKGNPRESNKLLSNKYDPEKREEKMDVLYRN